MGVLSRAARRIKEAWEWYILLAGLGVLPTAAAIFAVIEEQPMSVVLLYLAFGVAYSIVLFVEGQPLLDLLRTRRGPRVVFYKVRDGLMRDVQTGEALYFVVEAWFLNSPKSPTSDSIAQGVTGRIEIHGAGHKGETLEFLGRWAVGGQPYNVGFHKTPESIDIRPNALPAKLLVALKFPEATTAFAFAGENTESAYKGRHPRYAIRLGHHRVTIQLSGVGVRASFSFSLENEGDEAEGLRLSFIK